MHVSVHFDNVYILSDLRSPLTFVYVSIAISLIVLNSVTVLSYQLFFFLHVRTYPCLSTGTLGLFSVVCTFEWFSLQTFCACLISPLINRVAFRHFVLLQLFSCMYKLVAVHLNIMFSVACIFEQFSLQTFCVCLSSPFTYCIAFYHCALIQLFFACGNFWLSTGTSASMFVFCCVYFWMI